MINYKQLVQILVVWVAIFLHVITKKTKYAPIDKYLSTNLLA